MVKMREHMMSVIQVLDDLAREELKTTAVGWLLARGRRNWHKYENVPEEDILLGSESKLQHGRGPYQQHFSLPRGI